MRLLNYEHLVKYFQEKVIIIQATVGPTKRKMEKSLLGLAKEVVG